MKNNFKILVLCIIATLNFSYVNAQKCKFDYEKKDPFTGKPSKGNTSAIYPASPISSEYWYLGLNKMGDEFYIGMLLQLNGELNTYLEKGDSIMFKLSNNEVVTCYAKERSSLTSNVYVAGNQPVLTSQYRSHYDIPTDKLRLFTENLVTYIRMNVGDKVYQREIKEKHAKKLMKNSTCIIN